MALLHALLIGINKYQSPSVPTLSGCVNDVKAFEAYLKSAVVAPSVLRLLSLTDAEATKANIIQAVRTHFQSSAEDDTILIYFSGHGCREAAPPALNRFLGPWMESMMCHDSGTERPLSDLEWRYLFYELSQRSAARIVFVTDACHSGGASRDQALRARLGPAFDHPRQWEQFCFAAQHEQAHAETVDTLQDLLPQGPHIHLAACESRQSAFELSGYQGIFTANLLEVLKQTGGSISFDQLLQRLRYLVRRRFDQNPQLYAFEPSSGQSFFPDEQSILQSAFLPGMEPQPYELEVQYISGRWRIGMGALHGMPSPATADDLEIQILDRQERTVLTTADITRVMPAYSVFRPHDLLSLRPNQAGRYIALIKGLYAVPLMVQLHGPTEVLAAFKAELQPYLPQLEQLGVTINGNSGLRDYRLLITEEDITICEPLGNRPLLRPIERGRGQAASIFLRYMTHISHWHFVHRIENPKADSRLISALQWEVHFTSGLSAGTSLTEESQIDRPVHSLRVGSDTLSNIDEPIVDLPLPPADEEHKALGFLRIGLRNASDEVIYVSVLYLNQAFGVFNNGLVPEESASFVMEPATAGQTAKTTWVFGRQGVSVFLDDYIYRDNWPYEAGYIKLIISRTPFELGRAFEQQPLPTPDTPFSRSTLPERGQTEYATDGAWATKMISIHILNPSYQAHLAERGSISGNTNK